MARVTVGIPVYNGGPMLRECLDSLLAQTYKDFTVIIADNASTDETPEICAEYAKKDDRIRVIRHAGNLGALANFRYVVAKSTTEFFMWRADDDYSDSFFIEELVRSLDQNPDAQLAVPRVITRISDTEYTEETPFASVRMTNNADRLAAQLFNYHASICYGLWRSDYIQKTIVRICSSYPNAFACDHLILLSAFLDDAVVGNNSTLFTQRTYSPIKGDGLRGEQTLSARIAKLKYLMPPFYRTYESEVLSRKFPLEETRKILSMKRRYTYKKLRASRFRILRLQVKSVFYSVIGKSRK